MDIEVAAQLAEMPIDEFKALNPSHNTPVMVVDEDSHLILPKNKVDIFNTNLEQYKGELSSWKIYQASQGETFSDIARKFGVSETRIREVNNIPTSTRSASNQSLQIPGPSGKGIELAPFADSSPPRLAGKYNATTASNAKKNDHKVKIYVVRTGDTLPAIAKKHDTTVAALRSLNNIKNDTVKVGTKLRLPSNSTH